MFTLNKLYFNFFLSSQVCRRLQCALTDTLLPSSPKLCSIHPFLIPSSNQCSDRMLSKLLVRRGILALESSKPLSKCPGFLSLLMPGSVWAVLRPPQLGYWSRRKAAFSPSPSCWERGKTNWTRLYLSTSEGSSTKRSPHPTLTTHNNPVYQQWPHARHSHRLSTGHW